MDLSRLEADLRPQTLKTTCDLASVTYASYAAHLSQAEARGIGLELRDLLPEGQSCRVTLSATDATLIVNNLVDNAIAYTDAGSVSLRVSIEEGLAVLVVADTGIGIPPVDQERVFERFYRVDTARSRASGGTGLGLALVRHAVERGGGTIELKSEVGVGSTFVVRLPRASATA
jgi:signal transduction histidine kinase